MDKVTKEEIINLLESINPKYYSYLKKLLISLKTKED